MSKEEEIFFKLKKSIKKSKILSIKMLKTRKYLLKMYKNIVGKRQKGKSSFNNNVCQEVIGSIRKYLVL